MSQIAEVPEALQIADSALRRIGLDTESIACRLLGGVRDDGASCGPILAIKKRAGITGDEFERLLLWNAARQSLSSTGSLPIENSVRERLRDELGRLHAMDVSMAAGTYHFNRAAKIATLRRFPAGPMEWEVSGIPRSWLLRADFPDNLRLLGFVMLSVKGWAPCFEMHVAPSPRNRGLSVPKQVLRAYYVMIRSLQLQSHMRALLGCAWFHDPAAVRDYPHLEVLSRPFVKYGGLIVRLGPAPPSSGVLEGNAQRKADYMAGRIRYRYGLAIWPRNAAIKWADAHQDLE